MIVLSIFSDNGIHIETEDRANFHLALIIIALRCVPGYTGLSRAETWVRVAGVPPKKSMMTEAAPVRFAHFFSLRL